MSRLVRPWAGRFLDEETAFGPGDSLLSEITGPLPKDQEFVLLMQGALQGQGKALCLHPYPKREAALRPDRDGFPVRPRTGQEPKNDSEEIASQALGRMNEVLARVQELQEALDEPSETWPRLRAAWTRAQDEEDPRMAEIVRQARDLLPVVRNLEKRIRRVLRRHRELTPLDRVQEMDRASMVWLSRQPGKTVAERAGANQRILATVRQEDFNTLENRVFHSYLRLAADVAREWVRQHPNAQASNRYRAVDGFRKVCLSLARMLVGQSVGLAGPGATPNYVLMQDKGYRLVYDGWIKLLQRQKIEDDLWAWQAQAWTDFSVLAIVLALDELEESELVAQSPILWRDEAYTGRWFEQDRPLAVFWLRETGRVVEVQARPEVPGPLLTLARAHVALRITDPTRGDLPRRVAVWTPHAMQRFNLEQSAEDSLERVKQIQRFSSHEVLRNGLILAPAHGMSEAITKSHDNLSVNAIALGASGQTLADGLNALRAFARSEIYRGVT